MEQTISAHYEQQGISSDLLFTDVNETPVSPSKDVSKRNNKNKKEKGTYSCKHCLRKFQSFKKCVDHMKRKCFKDIKESDEYSENDSYDQDEKDLEVGLSLMRINSSKKQIVKKFEEDKKEIDHVLKQEAPEKEPEKEEQQPVEEKRTSIKEKSSIDSIPNFIRLGQFRKKSSIKMTDPKNNRPKNFYKEESEKDLMTVELDKMKEYNRIKEINDANKFHRMITFSDNNDSSMSGSSEEEGKIDYDTLTLNDIITIALEGKIFFLEIDKLNKICDTLDLKAKGNKDFLVDSIIRHVFTKENSQSIFSQVEVQEVSNKLLSYLNQLYGLKYKGYKTELVESMEQFLFIENFNPESFSTNITDTSLMKLMIGSFLDKLNLTQLTELCTKRCIEVSEEISEMIEGINEYLRGNL